MKIIKIYYQEFKNIIFEIDYIEECDSNIGVALEFSFKLQADAESKDYKFIFTIRLKYLKNRQMRE
ncbi:hypothetical protein [Galenea microaerophila]